jgi:hypothetical protein
MGKMQNEQGVDDVSRLDRPGRSRKKGGRPKAALNLGRKRPRRAYAGVNPHRRKVVVRCNNCKGGRQIAHGRSPYWTRANSRSWEHPAVLTGRNGVGSRVTRLSERRSASQHEP